MGIEWRKDFETTVPGAYSNMLVDFVKSQWNIEMVTNLLKSIGFY